MNSFLDWLLHSFVIGAIAAGIVWLCPVSWRVRVRQVVPVAAFGAMLLLTLGLVVPLPSFEISAPQALVRMAGPKAAWTHWLWIAGGSICLLRLAVGSLAVRRILKTSRPVPGVEWQDLLAECQQSLGMSGRVYLRLAGAGFIPSATGLLRRTVLLPDEALRWSVEERRLVLLHELGHFSRGDLWAHALGRLACAVHWFNPFAWMLQRHLAIEREYAVDALVIERGATPKTYATVLFQMATAMQRRPASAAAFLAMAEPRAGKLEQRVMRILQPMRKQGWLARLCDHSVCLAVASLLFLCTACKPVAHLVSDVSAWTAAEIQDRLAADPFPEDL